MVSFVHFFETLSLILTIIEAAELPTEVKRHRSISNPLVSRYESMTWPGVARSALITPSRSTPNLVDFDLTQQTHPTPQHSPSLVTNAISELIQSSIDDVDDIELKHQLEGYELIANDMTNVIQELLSTSNNSSLNIISGIIKYNFDCKKNHANEVIHQMSKRIPRVHDEMTNILNQLIEFMIKQDSQNLNTKETSGNTIKSSQDTKQQPSIHMFPAINLGVDGLADSIRSHIIITSIYPKYIIRIAEHFHQPEFLQQLAEKINSMIFFNHQLVSIYTFPPFTAKYHNELHQNTKLLSPLIQSPQQTYPNQTSFDQDTLPCLDINCSFTTPEEDTISISPLFPVRNTIQTPETYRKSKTRVLTGSRLSKSSKRSVLTKSRATKINRQTRSSPSTQLPNHISPRNNYSPSDRFTPSSHYNNTTPTSMFSSTNKECNDYIQMLFISWCLCGLFFSSTLSLSLILFCWYRRVNKNANNLRLSKVSMNKSQMPQSIYHSVNTPKPTANTSDNQYLLEQLQSLQFQVQQQQQHINQHQQQQQIPTYQISASINDYNKSVPIPQKHNICIPVQRKLSAEAERHLNYNNNLNNMNSNRPRSIYSPFNNNNIPIQHQMQVHSISNNNNNVTSSNHIMLSAPDAPGSNQNKSVRVDAANLLEFLENQRRKSSASNEKNVARQNNNQHKHDYVQRDDIKVEMDKNEYHINNVMNSGSSERLFDVIPSNKTKGNPKHNRNKIKRKKRKTYKKCNKQFTTQFGEESEFSISGMEKPLPLSNPASDNDDDHKHK